MQRRKYLMQFTNRRLSGQVDFQTGTKHMDRQKWHPGQQVSCTIPYATLKVPYCTVFNFFFVCRHVGAKCVSYVAVPTYFHTFSLFFQGFSA
jgi:hypothetical protein